MHGLRTLLPLSAEEKVKGKEPPLFPKELGSFQIGFVAFGAVIALFIIAYIIYILIEKRG